MNVFLSDLQFYALKEENIFSVRYIIYIFFEKNQPFFSFSNIFVKSFPVFFVKKTMQKSNYEKTRITCDENRNIIHHNMMIENKI